EAVQETAPEGLGVVGAAGQAAPDAQDRDGLVARPALGLELALQVVEREVGLLDQRGAHDVAPSARSFSARRASTSASDMSSTRARASAGADVAGPAVGGADSPSRPSSRASRAVRAAAVG